MGAIKDGEKDALDILKKDIKDYAKAQGATVIGNTIEDGFFSPDFIAGLERLKEDIFQQSRANRRGAGRKGDTAKYEKMRGLAKRIVHIYRQSYEDGSPLGPEQIAYYLNRANPKNNLSSSDVYQILLDEMNRTIKLQPIKEETEEDLAGEGHYRGAGWYESLKNLLKGLFSKSANVAPEPEESSSDESDEPTPRPFEAKEDLVGYSEALRSKRYNAFSRSPTIERHLPAAKDRDEEGNEIVREEKEPRIHPITGAFMGNPEVSRRGPTTGSQSAVSEEKEEVKVIPPKPEMPSDSELDSMAMKPVGRTTDKEHKAYEGRKHNLIARYRKHIADWEMKYQKHAKGKYRGGAPKVPTSGKPGSDVLQKMAKEAYNRNAPKEIDGWKLVSETPTLKYYHKGDTIMVAIRGTDPSDPGDLKADAFVAVGQLEKSQRFKKDLANLQHYKSNNPGFQYYGVGHSLGGAMLDAFIKKGLLKSGQSYNPAVQPQDLRGHVDNHRIYQQGDPIYAIEGRLLKDKPEVRKAPAKTIWDKTLDLIHPIKPALDALNAHGLQNFEGGTRKVAETATRGNPKFEAQLRKAGLEPSAYLEEAKRRAKLHHYPYKLLGFAQDGEHKLAIPDENGRVVSFGRVGNGDHLIYSHMEKAGSVASGTAEKKKNVFHKSHSKIKGDWKGNPFSANNLALRILW
jgi:hypothetical protein